MTARVTSIVGWGMPIILASFAGCGGAEGSSFDSNGGIHRSELAITAE